MTAREASYGSVTVGQKFNRSSWAIFFFEEPQLVGAVPLGVLFSPPQAAQLRPLRGLRQLPNECTHHTEHSHAHLYISPPIFLFPSFKLFEFELALCSSCVPR